MGKGQFNDSAAVRARVTRKTFDARSRLAATIFAASLLIAGCSGSSSQNDAASDAQSTVNQNAPSSGSGTGSGSSAGGSAPSLSLSASALEISEGGSVSLSWSATGADTCTASGGWSGNVGTSGSMNVGPLTAGTTFSLSCTGSGGSVLEMLSVGVIGPVQLSWVAPDENVDGSALTDLAGYRIYYGTSSRNYSDSVDLSDPGATAHTLTLASGDYYVAMTALDAEGNESGYSNEVIKTRL